MIQASERSTTPRRGRTTNPLASFGRLTVLRVRPRWVFARPTGALDLRGPHVLLWDEVLPVREPVARRADLDLLAARLVELAGGEALPA